MLEFYGDASTKVYENYKNAVQSENCEVCTSVDSINEVNGCTKKIMISSDGEVYIDKLIGYLRNNTFSLFVKGIVVFPSNPPTVKLPMFESNPLVIDTVLFTFAVNAI